MSAAVDGGVLVLLGFTSPAAGVTPGHFIIGGTSEASPLMAGLVSIASQVAHRRLGQINRAPYDLSGRDHGGILDVTSGNNIVTFTQDAQSLIFGFAAVDGYDVASGIGTGRRCALRSRTGLEGAQGRSEQRLHRLPWERPAVTPARSA